MKKYFWKKSVALMICVLMVLSSMSSASYALTAQESTAAGQTTESNQSKSVNQNTEKETSQAAEASTEEKAAETDKKNAGSSEVKNTERKESGEIETPKRKAVKFSASFAPKAAGEMATLKKTYRNPAEGVAKAVVQLKSAKDGYVAGDDLGVTFGVNLTLDEDYLYDGYEAHTGDAGFPKFDPNQEAFSKAVDEFFEDLPEESLKPIVYTYDLGTDFTVAVNDNGKREKREILKSNGEELGTLTAVKQDDGHCVVTITFKNKVYNRSDVQAGVTVSLEIDEEKLRDDEPVFAGWKDDKIVVDVKGSSNPDDPAVTDPRDYTVEKTAKEKVNTPYIDYTIEVNTKDTKTKDLRGLILQDQLPEGMEIESIQKGTTELSKGDKYGENAYRLDNGVLTYQFPKSPAETEATFKVRLRLTADAYRGALDKGVINKSGIKNTAKLLDADQKESKSDESTATTDMKFSVMSKDGKPEGMNGMRYAWTLDVNAQFSHMANAFIGDKICFDDHRFDGEAGIRVYIDGTYKDTVKFSEDTELSNSNPPSYEKLTKKDYDKLVNGKADPFYYVYTEKDAEGKAHKYAVLIIPFGEDYQNHKVQLKYYTDVWLEGKDGQEATVDDWLKEHGGELPKKDITNDAKFIWDWFKFGNGPGWEDFTWDVNLEKHTDTTVNLGSKTAGSYDEKTQTLKWKFIVNNYGAEMKKATITDTLEPEKYNLDNISLSYDQYSREPAKKIKSGEPIPRDNGDIHYTLDKAGKLVITLPETISANDYYEITLQTQVTDKDVLAQQGTKIGFANVAAFAAEVGGTPVSNTYNAKKDLTNTLITKEAVGSYDYDKKELAWQVAIDPNHISLTDLVVTDDLPTGNEFGTLTKVTRVDKDGVKHGNTANISTDGQAATLDNDIMISLGIKKGKDEDGYTKDQAVFTFSGKGTNAGYEEDSYIFDFTTKITDDVYLKKVFQGNTDVEVTNNVNFAGKYEGEKINGSAEAEAVHAIESGKITKNGEYLESDGKISWNITFNQDKADIGGMKLIEKIDSQPLEIDDTTFKLYTIESDGTETEYGSFNPNDCELIKDDGGFTYTIPNSNDIKYKTLVLKFDSYLTETTENANAIHNKARLMNGDDIYQESEESNGGYDGSFDIDEYVQAAKNPILQVMKTSVQNDPKTEKLPLAGAKFTATAYEKTADAVYNNPVSKYNKSGTTNDKGKLNLVNLKKDYVYKLEETKEPDGYQLELEPKYYLFTKSADLKDVEILTVGSERVEVTIIKANTLTGIYPPKALTDTWEDHPNKGMDIVFTKEDPLNHIFNDSKKATFKLEYEKDWLISRKVESDADGKIVYEQVDPGKYTLTEIKSDDPYDQGAVFDVEMKTDGNYTIKYREGNAKITVTKDSYVIQNEYAKGSIKLKKVGSDNGKISLKGAVFQLYDKDDKAIDGMTATTDRDGIATFSNVQYVPEGYTVKEITPPDGYSTDLLHKGQMPAEIRTITKEDMAEALKKANNQAGTAKSFTLDYTADTGQIENDRTKGTITLKKVDSDHKALSGREFQLLYNDSDKYDGWEKGHVAATETTNADGTLIFNDIPYGNYTLKETSPSEDNYSAYSQDFSLREAMQADLDANRKDTDKSNDNIFAIDLSKEGSPHGDIVNNLLTAGFSVEKQDATTKETMQTVQFTIKGKDADGKIVGSSKTTDARGIAGWTDIPIGADNGDTPYILSETKPDGYEKPAEYNVYVKSENKGTSPAIDNKAVVTIYEREANGSNGKAVAEKDGNYILSNQPITGSLQFTKTDSDGAKMLHGAEFRLYRIVNGLPVTDKEEWSQANPLGYHTATSGSNGAVKFEQVEYGNYQLKEIAPPAGYKLWEGTKEIKKDDLVISGGTFTYSGGDIENTKTDLKFLKKDQFGHPVKGAELKLTGTFANGSGEEEKTWISGEDAHGLAASLIAGNTYTLSETSAPPSGLYKKAEDVSFKVADDGTLTDFQGSYTYENIGGTPTLTLIDAYYLAGVKLKKQDSDGNPLTGITFNLYQQKGDKPAADDTLLAENLMTEADGTWTLASVDEKIVNPITKGQLKEGLSIGNYYFKETAATDGYVLDETPQLFTITADNDRMIVEKNITNKPVNASVALTKLDRQDDSGIAGTTFTLTRTKDGSGGSVTEGGKTQTTNSSGALTFTGLQKGTYTLKETTTNANYQPNETDKFACTFVVTGADADQTLQVNAANKGNATDFNLTKTQGTWNENGVTNNRKTGSVTLTKQGNINGDKQPLEGAEFTLYYANGADKDKPVQKSGKAIVGITDENGTFTIDDLAWAKYYLKETKVPRGYVIDETHLDFEIKAGTLSKGFQTSAGGEDIINNATAFTIAKKAADTQQTGLKGAEFVVEGTFADGTTSKTFDMSAVDSQSIYQQLVTGETYTAKETKAPAGYELDSTPIEIAVAKDGAIKIDGTSSANQTLTFRDKPIEIKLRKTDETGLRILSGGAYKVTPAEGSKFAVRDGETTAKEIPVTEANMQTQLSGRLIAGNSYVLTEITAPEGYAVAKPVTFTVDQNGNAAITSGTEIAKITPDPQTPTLNLKDDKIRVKLEKVNTAGTALDGAIFTVTPDLASNSKFAVIKTGEVPPASIDVPISLDKDGNLVSQTELDGRLITGNRYILSEKVQPSGYIKLQDGIMVEVKDGEKLEIISSKDAKENAAVIQDEGKTVQITDQANKLVIKKQDDSGKALCTDDLELQIKDSQDSVISTLNKENQDAETAGVWTLNAQLTAGKTYTITESKTPYGYLKASDIQFIMEDDGSVTVISGAEKTANKENSNNLYLEDVSAFIMRDVLIQGAVSLHKTDSQGTALSGVEFDLYRMEEDEPDLKTDTKVNAAPLIADRNGMVRTEELGEGQYYFAETAAHADKLFDPTPTKLLTIDKAQHKKTVSLDAVNKDFLTSVHLIKKDGEDGGAIANTQFTLYKIEGGKDAVVSSGTTDAEGDLTFKLTSKGDYKIVETQASKGYELKTDKPFTAKFSVENTNVFQDKTLELTEGPSDTIKNQYKLSYENASFYEKTAAANQRILGKLTLRKADQADSKALDGAEFTLYKEKDSGGFESVWNFITGNKYEPAETMKWSQQAGETGKITVSGLAWGNYYIKETKAADGYQLPKDARYDFTIGRNANDITLTADAGTITNLQTKIAFAKMGKYIESCSDVDLGAFSPDSLRPVSGAEFAISKKETPDTIIKTASSNADGKVEFYKLSPGTYCIKETKAPKGYLKDNTTYTVKISQTGECGGLIPMKGAGSLISGDSGDQLVNDVARTAIEIKKVSEQKQDQPIAGSTYGLYRKAPQSSAPQSSAPQPSAVKGKSASYVMAKNSADTQALQLIAKATTGEDGYLRFEGVLMGVDYVIRELVAPAGSQVSEKPITIVFNLDANTGKTVITHYEDGNGTAQIDPDTGQIIWKEPSIMLSFDKTDEKGNLLKGAQLELQTKDGEVIDSWTSSDKQAHIIYGDRMDGKITEAGVYQLVETAAPEGYLTADSVSFTVETKPTGPQEKFVQTITMVDKKKPVDASKPAQGTAGGGSAESAKTGDDFPIQLWLLLLLLSGGAAVIVIRKKKSK